MQRPEFEKLIAEEFPKAVPEKFRDMVKNVAFVVEETPSREVRQKEHLASNETLLGLYHGVPHARRGDHYGVGATVPDVITLFRIPIHDEAQERIEQNRDQTFDDALRTVVYDTIWHEVAHYIGLGEEAVRAREEERREDPPMPEPDTTQTRKPAIFADALGEGTPIDLFPQSARAHMETVKKQWRSTMEPIEVEKEDPSMAAMMHESLLPESENYSSIDSEGGSDGTQNWWEEKELEKTENKDSDEQPISKRGEPPANLPTFEG